ncbi:transposase [Pedobacter chinensis]|uniref:Transposase n=1 Tax=Pedobacter chinensis TaxID=2282421 RepID=A0A369PWF2_9SPHI|nr:transposase [Pedobacter chinensis]RDC55036.1 transposase [Pedobacter chinensis]
MNIFHKRQGQMDYNYPYFYTDTICDFRNLLENDQFKLIVMNSLQFLVQQKLVEIYGYVIMPNHIHLIWNMLKLNGKESPVASFTKFTAHQFRKYLITHNPHLLEHYKSKKEDRHYQFWKRDPLAIPLSTENILIQKLDYIHENPIKDRWRLCKYPEDYAWSSARFYKDGIDNFGILKHFRD